VSQTAGEAWLQNEPLTGPTLAPALGLRAGIDDSFLLPQTAL
jgi:hypothetical protein